MNIKEIIMVTENDRGSETNCLCTYEDYIRNYVLDVSEDNRAISDMTCDIIETRGEIKTWAEIYYAPNRTVIAKYCTDREQLLKFLKGEFDEQNADFSESKSSEECLCYIRGLGIDTDGSMLPVAIPHYEKIEKNFKQGEILHNFNGSDYRVMEMLSDKNLLLMDVAHGNFVVAVGTDYYARYPKEEGRNSQFCEMGIEWQHGVYLGNTLSVIDFADIRNEYGKTDRIIEESSEDVVYQVEVEERLSKVIELKAESKEDALSIARQQYYDQQIILDENDIKSVDFKNYGVRELCREKSR